MSKISCVWAPVKIFLCVASRRIDNMFLDVHIFLATKSNSTLMLKIIFLFCANKEKGSFAGKLKRLLYVAEEDD